MSTATAIVPSSTQVISRGSVASNSAQPRSTQNVAARVKQPPAVPSPGRFRHPRMREIARRQAKTQFTWGKQVTVLVNSALLFGSFIVSDAAYAVAGALTLVPTAGQYLDDWWLIFFYRLFLLTNMFYALRPLLPYFDKPDTVDDILLTPSQRALLGLPQSHSNTPNSATGEGNYVTPPRYRKSSPSPYTGTPQSGRSVSANYSPSPLFASRYTAGFSPTPQQSSATPSRRLSGSPFSPLSPLFNKAVRASSRNANDIASNADFTESTRSMLAGVNTSSYGGGSLRRSQSMRERGGFGKEPGTPSPGARERTNVNVQPGLNYKWLYEKGLNVNKDGVIQY